jgi:phospho-N-acetylmuramoyl-pentapeptide-transferase
MLYYLFEYLEKEFNLPGAGLFQYISFRAGAGIILALILSMISGNRIIRSLKRLQIGETVRDLGLEGQVEKEGTPTMGGLIILVAVIVPVLLFAKLDNIYIILMVVTTLWMAAIGFVDDYIKVFRKNKKGLKAKFKIFGQVSLGLIIGLTMLYHSDILVRMPKDVAIENNYRIEKTFETQVSAVNSPRNTEEVAYVKTSLTNLPFTKDNQFDYGFIFRKLGLDDFKWLWLIFVPIIIFIITAVSNASNLTDGLDGLTSGLAAIIGATLGALAYVSSNTIIADYLNILYIPFSEELVVFAAIFLGATVGFLWHNSYPAKIFMGDTGSLMIGGVIASLAILLRKELLIPILCGVFLAETVSVIIQVSYFRFTKKRTGVGKRIFLMSPLHHHFQMKKMHESKIVTRFWIVGIMLAVFTIITLKLR